MGYLLLTYRIDELVKSRKSIEFVISANPGSGPGQAPESSYYHPPLTLPEAVKKFRQGEIGGPGDARGRNKFAPPKQALVSPWPAWYLTH
jgi:hypothetical protein